MRLSFIVLLLGALSACGDGFSAAQQAHTIEAYEAFLRDNPGSRHTLNATAVLETLYLEEARKQGSLEAYDRYLERFPEGDLHERALEERETFLFDWAKERGTPEGWERFTTEYPSANKKRKAEAKRLHAVASYAGQLKTTPLKIEAVNLAQDPNGPKNGWGFTMDVTNAGTRTLTDLRFTIDLTGPSGSALESHEWPVVAEVWPLPIEEERKIPMKPGDTRTWMWSQEDPAPGKWKQTATVRPTRLTLAD